MVLFTTLHSEQAMVTLQGMAEHSFSIVFKYQSYDKKKKMKIGNNSA